MSAETLHLPLTNRNYSIYFDHAPERLQEELAGLRSAGRSVRVISDTGVLQTQPAYLKQLGFYEEEILELPPGEPTKSIEYFGQCLNFLADQSCNRDCALFAFGGGVIGDLTGYVASAYLRGIDFYQIPTTLLAMVDSSVGGKTGINLAKGKNLVGAFWQPKAVYIDTTLLQTLPSREFAAGMAEVIKYGMLADATLFEHLETLDALTSQSPELPEIIARCCKIKADIVAEDEKELALSGGRALLNLGHTFAHAIENVAGYGQYLHGEAVAIGLILATRLSIAMRQMDGRDLLRIDRIIRQFHLPTRLNKALEVSDLMAAIKKDKKNHSGQLRFITMTAIGHAIISDKVDIRLVKNLWIEAGAASRG